MANKIPLAIADVELQLAVAISIGDTTLTLSSATDDDGNSLPAGMYCFTLDSGTSNKEYLIGQLNGVNVTSLKSVSRQGIETTGAARAHRVGAPCIVTNFATLQRVADILRGQDTLDGSNPIVYDTEPTLADRKELATVGYVLDIVNGGTVSFDEQVITGNAGESIVAGNLVYFKTSDQEWYKTDADTAATIEGVQLGIALGSGSDGVSITGGIQIAGTYTTSGLTAGATYYASNTAGAIASSAGTVSQVVGLALSTTKLLLIPKNPQTPTAREKDAMVGTSGTPSSTNKYVTNDDTATTPTSGKVVRLNGLNGVSRVLLTSASTTEIANNSAVETDIFSVSIPANLLQTTNAIRFKVFVSDFTTVSVSAGAATFRLKYGSTTIATVTNTVPGTGVTLKGVVEGMLVSASTTSQLGTMQLTFSEDQLNPFLDYGTATAISFFKALATGTGAENSAGALDLKLTIQWAGANATNNFIPAGVLVELIS